MENKNNPSIFLNRYKNKRRLGKGAFGDVFLVEDQKGQFFALKLISIDKMTGENEFMQEYLQEEITCMKQMDCKHIVKMQMVEKDQNYVYIILEYCDGGDLMNVQAKFKEKVYPLDVATEYLSQVIKGLQQLHKRQYLHRDIKLQNVLIKNEDGKNVMKIADFGFSKKATKAFNTVCGTEQYMSPEIYKGGMNESSDEVYGYEVDMWAFGVLFYYMLNLAFPFCIFCHYIEILPYWDLKTKHEQLSKMAKLFSYKKSVVATRKKLTVNCTDDMQDLFSKIFQVDTNKRINFSEIRQHPVFSKHFPEASAQSKILYKAKFKNRLAQKYSQLKSSKMTQNLKSRMNNAQKLNVASFIEQFRKQLTFNEQKQFIQLELEQVNFLKAAVDDIDLVQMDLGYIQSLMFAYNLVKYYILLFRKFINNLSPNIYYKKKNSLNWNEYFNSEEFKKTKKEYAHSFQNITMKFEQLHQKCRTILPQLAKLNPFFEAAFDLEFANEDLDGDFFRSYRKSTNLIYVSLRGFDKSKKKLNYYYYLCISCICHVFCDFYQNKNLKEEIFDDFLKTNKMSVSNFSFKRFKFYLENCGKQKLLILTKSLIQNCMKG